MAVEAFESGLASGRSSYNRSSGCLPAVGEMALVWIEGAEAAAIKIVSRTIRGWPHSPESDVETLVYLEQLNPPREYAIRSSRIQQIARVHSIVG